MLDNSLFIHDFDSSAHISMFKMSSSNIANVAILINGWAQYNTFIEKAFNLICVHLSCSKNINEIRLSFNTIKIVTLH